MAKSKLGARFRVTLIKVLLLPLLLSVCATANANCVIDTGDITSNAIGVIAIGDSITSAPGSWADVLGDCGWRIKLLAQGGRLAQGYNLPPDIRVTEEFPFLVYFLGTNDYNAEFVSDGPVSAEYLANFQVKFVEHINHVSGQNFLPIILIPADYPRLQDGVPGGREFMIEFCAEESVPMICIDMEDHWDYTQTINDDQIHPKPPLHATIATVVNDVLVTLPVPQSSIPPGC